MQYDSMHTGKDNITSILTSIYNIGPKVAPKSDSYISATSITTRYVISKLRLYYLVCSVSYTIIYMYTYVSLFRSIHVMKNIAIDICNTLHRFVLIC